MGERAIRGAVIGAVVGGVVLSVVAVVAIPVVLTAVGFTAAGVAVGSAAAAVQATYGGFVAGGSVFAACQSMGALGAASAAAVAAVGTGGATAGVAVGGVVGAATSLKLSTRPGLLDRMRAVLRRQGPAAASQASADATGVEALAVWERARQQAFPVRG